MMSGDRTEDVQTPHNDFMAECRSRLADIFEDDALLSDLHADMTVEELGAALTVEYGQAITLHVRRADGIIYPIVVVQNATVMDLKHAIRRHVMLKQAREKGTQHISWKYVWKRYWLYDPEGRQKLSDNNKKLKDYGIRNRSELTFIKRLRER